MAGKTAVFSPEKMLELTGIDELERMEEEPNPFWNRTRFEVIWALPVMAGILDEKHVSVMPMRLATLDELRLFHDSSYIETIDLFGNMGTAFATRFGLPSKECPVFSEMNLYAKYPVGATIDAVMGVAEGRFKNAVSFYGGFHHAFESKAAGFCYFNDSVIAIKALKQRYPDIRVLYLDTDVHHGDGTEIAFYDDPDVLTISIHEKSLGFFPGTGEIGAIGEGAGKGYNINIPIPPLTEDADYWRVFEEIVVPIWRAYHPDFVIWEVGADAHAADPLSDIMLYLDTYQRMSRTVREMVYRLNSKLVVLGGGGYNPVTTARVWTLVLADIAEICLPPALPDEWLDLCKKHGLKNKRTGWTDYPLRFGIEHLPKIRAAINRTINEIKELVFPIFGLSS